MKTVTVYYTTFIFSSLQIRNRNTGILIIREKQFTFEDETITFSSKDIYKMDYLKMPGDLSKNWIHIQLRNFKKFYLSEKRLLHGLGNVFGGNKALFIELKSKL